MNSTIVRIVTESNIPVTFITESGMEAVLTNIEVLACRADSTSSTILSGLLQGERTRPIDSAEDMVLATVIYTSRTRMLKWCKRGRNDVSAKLLNKAIT